MEIEANLTTFNATREGQRKWEVCSTQPGEHEQGGDQYDDVVTNKLITLTVTALNESPKLLIGIYDIGTWQ